jgi:isoleucyl-tRNA synthetase
MAEATRLLDDLSNWYIRRNRRRFWKSENDSDKTAAYSTLYRVLINFVKVIAPIVPFISDKIYGNLVLRNNETNFDSVHLCDFPSVNPSDIDENVLNEIDVVIQIVSLSRSARNKANIKIRQPLSELALFAIDDIQKIAENNKAEILEELNIKELNFVEKESDLVQYNVKPDFPTLGQKYGKDIGRITAYLKSVDSQELVQKVKKMNSVIIAGKDGDLEILPEELILEEVSVNNYAVSSGKNFIVGISTEISESLKQEGLVRDLIRQVQNLRKDSGLKVEDRIKIEINGSKELNNAVVSYESYFMNEVLGVKLDMGDCITFKYNDSVKIAGEKTIIGISPLI